MNIIKINDLNKMRKKYIVNDAYKVLFTNNIIFYWKNGDIHGIDKTVLMKGCYYWNGEYLE